MPKSRKTTTVEEIEGAEDAQYVEVNEPDDDEQTEFDALEGLVSEFAGAADAVVNVYRQGEGKNISFLFRTNPAEMTGGEIMERCRDHYGTGDYRVHIRKGPRIVANRPFSVETKKAPDPDDYQRRDDSSEKMLAFITAQMNNQQAMFSETMKAMAEAFRGNQQPAFDPVAANRSMIESLAALKGMTDPKPDDGGKSAMEMLIQGVNLAKDLAPRDGETNSTDVLLKAIEKFGGPLVEAATHYQKVPPDKSLLTPPNNQDKKAQTDAEREKQMNLRNIMLKRQLGFLVQNAAAGKNPELYAELLLDQLGEKTVLDFINKPDAMDKLIALDPNVANYRWWFEQLKSAVLEMVNDSGDDNETPAVNVPGIEDGAVSDADDSSDASRATAGGGGDAENAETDA